MTAVWHGRSLVYMLALIMAGSTGCRKTDPPPPHFRDLGTDAAPLLPTAYVWQDPAIAQGQAEWRPFRELGSVPPVGVDLRSTGEGTQPDNSRIETEIRELIDEYNDFVAEATVDELLDYYVEEQHDTLKPLFEAARTFAQIYVGVREELVAKLPDAKQRIDAALAVLEADVAVKFHVEAITVVNDTEATGKVASGWIARTCRFRLVDEDWYIEVPQLGPFADLAPAIDAGLTLQRGWLQALQSGQVSPDTILQQVEAASKAVKTVTQLLEQGGPSGADDAAEP